jgi:hypothetical protein
MAPYGRRRRAWRTRCARAVRSIRRSAPKGRDGPATAAVPTRSATSPRRVPAPGGALLRRRFPAFPGDPARPARRLVAVGIAGPGVPDARVRFPPIRRSVPKRRDGPATAAVPTRSATSPRRIRAPGCALRRRRVPAFPGDPARPAWRLVAVGAGPGVPDARVRFPPFVGAHRRGAMAPRLRWCQRDPQRPRAGFAPLAVRSYAGVSRRFPAIRRDPHGALWPSAPGVAYPMRACGSLHS